MRHTQGPEPPEYLSDEACEVWKTLNDEYNFETSDLMLLQTALECYDRLQICRRLIDKEGVLVEDPSGRKRAHPALTAEKEARSGLLQAWRLLALDEEPPGPVGRPAGG